jgi:periplasmic protein TonB
MNLGGTDSLTNAVVTGEDVIPARVDATWRNREPVYPRAAALRGEEGAVILLVHVSPMGLASGVQVVQSSGFGRLDQSARDAVATWRFVPAVRDGLPVPFDVPVRVVFELR